MKKLLIVCFAEKRHGKGEAARVLAEELNGTVTSFAASLKRCAEQLVGVPCDLPEGDKESKLFYGRTARHWWQWLGTEIGRRLVSETVWVDRTIGFVRKQPAGSVVIVDDGRFENERKIPGPALEDGEDGATVMNLLIYRPGLSEADNHPSEVEVCQMRKAHMSGSSFLFDDVIVNNGTLEQFREQVRKLARGLVGVEA